MEKSGRAHVLIVQAPYYRDIVEQLLAGATAELEAAGASWEVRDVAGAFELPVAIALAEREAPGRFHAYLAIGCVIRGETSHYDLICNEAARALQNLAVSRGLAIGFGLLTCEDGAQARARADVSRKNKGGEAARACLSVLSFKASLQASS